MNGLIVKHKGSEIAIWHATIRAELDCVEAEIAHKKTAI